MSEDSGEKTEQPTPHKLREARKKGQVAKSKDLTAAFLLVIAFYMLKIMSTYIWSQMTLILEESYNMIPLEFTVSTVGLLLWHVLWAFAKSIGPIFGVNFLAAVIFEMLQTGVVFSLEPLKPDLNKLNIIEGVKKLFSLKQVVELVKSIAKMVIVTWIIIAAVQEEFYMVLIAQQLHPWQMIAFVGELVMKIVLRLGMFYLLIGILDFIYQHYEYVKGLKMSKKEIKDEYKRLEGDPMIKQRQRDAQRQMAEGRQMGAVPNSDVVVTNPTHIAVAIEYKANQMLAPKVVAKGENLIAETIKRIAEESKVPVIENKALARALFKTTQVDHPIPPPYYQAVAEILAFVYNLRKKKKHRY